jgi:hypothetical protein
VITATGKPLVLYGFAWTRLTVMFTETPLIGNNAASGHDRVTGGPRLPPDEACAV